jgi:septal ring factor EnvC (AmiA/AmiB activator)
LADSPEGRAQAARQVDDALEAEIGPIRAAVVSLERERADVARSIGMLSGEIDGHERQLQQIHQAEHQRAQLVGRLGWSDRLSAILRRVRDVAA